MSLRTMRYVLWGLVALAFAGLAGFAATQWLLDRGGAPSAGAVRIGGPFSLVGTDGETVTSEDFGGRARAMFFGFTHCPDVCPTTLFEAAAWLEALGPDAERIAMIFVTVDPERDTPEVMKSYVGAFDERIVGLTGDRPAIDAMLKDYRVYARKVPLDDGGYTMDHSASVLLFDGNGDFHSFISYGDSQDVALGKIRRVLGADG